jgi:hypothetical protein
VERRIDTRTRFAGDVEVTSSGGDVTIADRIDARGVSSGGTIRLQGAGTLSVSGSLLARGMFLFGGAIFARGATVSLVAPVFDVRSTPGGTIYGGTIEATATGDLTASGKFRSVTNGCIALTAGGTLDTSGASFDTSLLADCPGSPSGAFLD